MNTTAFITQVRVLAEILKPLTIAGMNLPDPYALCWWGILSTIAELLEAQESPISDKQLDYIKKALFGGMGSLTDLWFDPGILGSNAELINNQLKIQRPILYNLLSH